MNNKEDTLNVEEVKGELQRLQKEFALHFKNYAAWVYPKNKEVREVMTAFPFLSSVTESILEMFLPKLFEEDKRIARKWLILFRRILNEKVSDLHKRTGMISTEEGLMLDPDMKAR